MRYENGYSDYLEVLDTERSLFSAELQLASARGDYQRALVNLYRALGGDWTNASSASAYQPAQSRGNKSMTDSRTNAAGAGQSRTENRRRRRRRQPRRRQARCARSS